MFVIGSNGASTGYNLTRSLRFRASATPSLSRTMTTPTNNKIWTICAMVKLGAISALSRLMTTNVTVSNLAPATFMYFDSNAQFNFYEWQGGVNNYVMTGAPVFRDPSAWYQIVIAIDTTQATNSNRVKVYFNNTQLTLTASGSGWIPQNTNTGMNSALPQYIGRAYDGGYFDGCMAEFNFIDGQALTPSSFGSTNALTGVWQPAAYTGSYGTNGFYLPFTDNSALTTASNVGLGKDFSGNGNYWTTNNISITAGVTYDSMTDVPTLTSATAANFAVLNPLQNPNGTIVTYSGANLNYSYSSGTANKMTVLSTIGITSDKFYCEFTEGSSVNSFVGISAGLVSGGGANGTYYAATGGGINGSSAATYSGTSLSTATGNIVGLAFDATALTLAIYKNNTLQGTFSGIESGKTWFMMIAPYTGASAGDGILNFGQRPFTYTPPTGFVALNTYNLPTSTIVKGNTVMDATLYTGNSSTQTVTNAGAFKPDFVWIKNRSTASQHVLTDSVRSITKQLFSSNTNAEQTSATGITALNSNGFSLGANVSPTGSTNSSPDSYVGWQWQAGQGTSSSNTSGTITSTVSVNASAGFSVVTFTANGTAGATIGHGLGVAPAFYIIKSRSNSPTDWMVYSQVLGTGFLYLSLTNAYSSSNFLTNGVAPTSSVITLGSSSNFNVNGYTNVVYAWTPIAGFSAFGSYTGNGSTDGTFVYTGFRPKFVMIKRTDSAGFYWRIWDSSRATYNAGLPILYPNVSDAEDSVADVFDLLSNGFKLRTTTTGSNASGGTYIYMAFAENPLKNSLAR